MSDQHHPGNGEQQKGLFFRVIWRHWRHSRFAVAGAVSDVGVGVFAAVLIALVRLYQLTLSRFLGGQCRFVPTCSEYFIDAVRARGPLVGSLKGLRRILRCNPFSKGGYDPVE